jgi:hypothetical protein
MEQAKPVNIRFSWKPPVVALLLGAAAYATARKVAAWSSPASFLLATGVAGGTYVIGGRRRQEEQPAPPKQKETLPPEEQQRSPPTTEGAKRAFDRAWQELDTKKELPQGWKYQWVEEDLIGCDPETEVLKILQGDAKESPAISWCKSDLSGPRGATWEVEYHRLQFDVMHTTTDDDFVKYMHRAVASYGNGWKVVPRSSADENAASLRVDLEKEGTKASLFPFDTRSYFCSVQREETFPATISRASLRDKGASHLFSTLDFLASKLKAEEEEPQPTSGAENRRQPQPSIFQQVGRAIASVVPGRKPLATKRATD